MDINALIEQVMEIVRKRLRQRLLILADKDGAISAKLSANAKIAETYEIAGPEAAAEADVVVVASLSVPMLAKISFACGHDGHGVFSSTVINAVLAGKKVLIINEGVELYQFKDSAPAAYYAMLLEKIKFLQACQIVFCDAKALENILTASGAAAPVASGACCAVSSAKRAITQRDVSEAKSNGQKLLAVGSKTIVTDSAREYAAKFGISIVRG